jgi:hypothetical protein
VRTHYRLGCILVQPFNNLLEKGWTKITSKFIMRTHYRLGWTKITSKFIVRTHYRLGCILVQPFSKRLFWPNLFLKGCFGPTFF